MKKTPGDTTSNVSAIVPNLESELQSAGLWPPANYSKETAIELGALLGGESAAHRLLFVWVGLAGIYTEADEDAFVAPKERNRTNAVRVKQLQNVVKHLDALLPLLDDRLAWLIACALPGISDGPEEAWQVDVRVKELAQTLRDLRADVVMALRVLPVGRTGRPLKLNPRLMLTLSLVGWLKEAGVPMSTAERSRMVQAVRVCWGVAGIDGDPRDLLRTLDARSGKAASVKKKGAKVVPMR